MKRNSSTKNIQDYSHITSDITKVNENNKLTDEISNNVICNKQQNQYQHHRPNSSFNAINNNNANNLRNIKIINLKQKLQDQILFGNERKHSYQITNKEKSKSKSKNQDSYYQNTRSSKGIKFHIKYKSIFHLIYFKL